MCRRDGGEWKDRVEFLENVRSSVGRFYSVGENLVHGGGNEITGIGKSMCAYTTRLNRIG